MEIVRVDQLETIASTTAGEIVDVVELVGPVSIKEIARLLGKPVHSLYYHVKKLKFVGLLVEVGKQKAIRQDEILVDVPSRPLTVQFRPSDSSFVLALIKSVEAMLRLAGRNLRSAFNKELVRELDGGRNVVHARTLGWFTEKEITEMRAEIDELILTFKSKSIRRGTASQLYALTCVMAPLPSEAVDGNSAVQTDQ